MPRLALCEACPRAEHYVNSRVADTFITDAWYQQESGCLLLETGRLLKWFGYMPTVNTPRDCFCGFLGISGASLSSELPT
jgi:hypothetical protein